MVPAQLTIEKGEAVQIAAEFSDINATDTLSVEVAGLPAGLQAVPGEQFEGRREMRVYGSLADTAPAGTVYEVTWTVSDGTAMQSGQTAVHTKASALSQTELEDRVDRLIETHYSHGLPPPSARALGSAALPILGRMLRDERYKPQWNKIAQAIGNIGDTAYFDTLRAFIWDRFRGRIDRATLTAIEITQNNLYPMASIMPRALDYLIATATPAAWSSLPWNLPDYPPSAVAVNMSRFTLSALSLTDSERVQEILDSQPGPADAQSLRGSYEAAFLRDLRGTHTRVRRRGFIRVWEERADWRGEENR
jgi:hypothetical protein